MAAGFKSFLWWAAKPSDAPSTTSGGGRRYHSPGWKDVLDLRDTPNDDDEVIMAVIKEFLRIAT